MFTIIYLMHKHIVDICGWVLERISRVFVWNLLYFPFTDKKETKSKRRKSIIIELPTAICIQEETAQIEVHKYECELKQASMHLTYNNYEHTHTYSDSALGNFIQSMCERKKRRHFKAIFFFLFSLVHVFEEKFSEEHQTNSFSFFFFSLSRLRITHICVCICNVKRTLIMSILSLP